MIFSVAAGEFRSQNSLFPWCFASCLGGRHPEIIRQDEAVLEIIHDLF
jgi:hypothetical protein